MFYVQRGVRGPPRQSVSVEKCPKTEMQVFIEELPPDNDPAYKEHSWLACDCSGPAAPLSVLGDLSGTFKGILVSRDDSMCSLFFCLLFFVVVLVVVAVGVLSFVVCVCLVCVCVLLFVTCLSVVVFCLFLVVVPSSVSLLLVSAVSLGLAGFVFVFCF